jgi:hypothetical protein
MGGVLYRRASRSPFGVHAFVPHAWFWSGTFVIVGSRKRPEDVSHNEGEQGENQARPDNGWCSTCLKVFQVGLCSFMHDIAPT